MSNVYLENLTQTAIDVSDKNPLILYESTNLAEAAGVIRKEHISSVLVRRDSQHVTGIVTERDILYHVVAESKGPFKTTLKEIMKNGQVVGILTLVSIIGNNRNESVELAEVELPGTVESKIMCLYCQSKFSSKEELSKHINILHLGSGLE